MTRKRLRILFVRPAIGFKSYGSTKETIVDEAAMEPLPYAVLAALSPPYAEISVVDDRMEPLDFDVDTDMIGITVETYTAMRSYQIAAEFRKRGRTVVLGGIHTTLIPEEAALHADAIITGDAENAWPLLIEDFMQNKLQARYHGGLQCPHPGLLPNKSIFAGKKYLRISLIQFGRGCPHGCTFCAVSAYSDRKHVHRRIDEIVNEISREGRKIYFFVDDNLTANPQAAKELMRAIAPLRIQWVSQASMDSANDPELLLLMQKSGCLGHVVGFESISTDGLAAMNKTPNMNHFSNYEQPIKAFAHHGLQLWAAFTLGHDAETKLSIQQTLEFSRKHKFAFAAYNILVPYPCTPFYENLKQQNRLLFDGKWWLHPDYHFNQAAFVPKHMTAQELTQECFRIKQEFNDLPTIASRLLHTLSSYKTIRRIVSLARYSLLFRQEVYKKNGMNFGFAAQPAK